MALLIYGSLITLFFPFLNAFRWLAAVQCLGFRMGFPQAFFITMASWPLGTITPAKTGEFLKVNPLLGKLRLSQALGTVLAERVIDILILGIFGVIFGILFGSVWGALGGFVGVGGALTLLVIPWVGLPYMKEGKLKSRFQGLYEVIPALVRDRRRLFVCVAASGLNWFLSIFQLWILLAAFGVTIPLGFIFAILPAATFVGLLPITIAGAGTRDAALLVFAGEAIAAPAMLASSLIYTLTGYFFLGICGLPFLKFLMTDNRD